MPTIRRIEGARFFFYSADGAERPHVHVELSGRSAKFWLGPVSLAKPGRLGWHELRRLRRLVIEHEQEFLEAWREFFEA